MKRFNLILLIFLLSPLTSFAQDEQEKRFPIRLNNFFVNQTQDNYQVDIINMFSDHLTLDSEPTKSIEWGFNVRLLSFLDFVYRRHSFTTTFKKNDAKYIFDEYEYDFDSYQMALSFHLYTLALEIGVGNRTFHTFLESDTTYYYHEKIKSNFKFLKIHYTYPTSLYFDINIFIEQSIVDTEEYNEFSIIEGDIKFFGTKFIFGRKYQLALIFGHFYSNIKYAHNFFGLKNEMNNKLFQERLGLEFTYNF